MLAGILNANRAIIGVGPFDLRIINEYKSIRWLLLSCPLLVSRLAAMLSRSHRDAAVLRLRRPLVFKVQRHILIWAES